MGCSVIDFCLAGETLLRLLPSAALPCSSRATKLGYRKSLSSASLPFSCTLKIHLLPMWPAHTDISNPNVCIWAQCMVSVPMASGLFWCPRDRTESFPGLRTSALAQGWYHTHPYKCACCSLSVFKSVRLLQAHTIVYKIVNIYKISLWSGITSLTQTPSKDISLLNALSSILWGGYYRERTDSWSWGGHSAAVKENSALLESELA